MMQIDQIWLACDCGVSADCKDAVIYNDTLLNVNFNDMSDYFLESCRDRSKEEGDDLEGWKFKVTYDVPDTEEYEGFFEESDVICPECVKVITNLKEKVYAKDDN